MNAVWFALHAVTFQETSILAEEEKKHISGHKQVSPLFRTTTVLENLVSEVQPSM